MNFIKRGMLSILRRPMKSLILLLIIFILGDVMAGAISVEQAIKKAEKNVLMKTGAIATLEIDYEKTKNLTSDQYLKEVKSISIAKINEIGKSEYLSYYDFTSSVGLQTTTLKRYSEQGTSYPGVKDVIPYYSEDADISLPSTELQYFNINGIQEKNMIDIQLKKIKLVEGRKFNDEEINNLKRVAIVSKNFAKTNNLRLGSKINLENIVYKMGGNMELKGAREGEWESQIQATQEVELEIIGIFEVIRPAVKDPNKDYIYNELENRIYTTNKVVENVIQFTINEYKKTNPEYAEQYASSSYITPLFVIKDPLNLDAFKESIKDDVPKYYKITDNSSSYKKIAAPMKNMQWIASIVLYVSIGATLLILSLLITLFLRDRKHEIGIYLALGERKKRIIGQVVFEVVAVAFVGITLALFTGGLIAGSISKKMLNNQMIEDANKPNDGGIGIDIGFEPSSSLDWMGYGSNITSDDIMNAYSVSIGGITIILFYLIGLGTVLVSTIVPVTYVIRLKPKKILM